MDQTKRPYETTFIVNASIDDTQIEATIARMQQFISNNGGEIVALNRMGRKRMAYTIRKKNNGSGCINWMRTYFDISRSSWIRKRCRRVLLHPRRQTRYPRRRWKGNRSSATTTRSKTGQSCRLTRSCN